MSDEKAGEAFTAATQKYTDKLSRASQWQLVWWRFNKHKLAKASGIVLLIIYFLAVFCEFFAPYDPNRYNSAYIYVPPQRPRFFTPQGFRLRPVVYGHRLEKDPVTLRRSYVVDREQAYPLRFFARGDPYRFLGIWETDIHLFGVEDGYFFPFGTDSYGRDMFSRILYGARISTTVGLVGVLFSLVLGILIGGASGYFGGITDTVVQRFIEFLRSIPTVPLWLGLSAALPTRWSIIKVYFGITIILSLIGWTTLARVVRSKFLALRSEDFVVSAQLSGAGSFRVITKHLIPSFMSHIIAEVTLAIPGMILGETALSFLGLGLRPPAISWGVLLQEAQNVRSLALAPWLLLPGVFVIITVLAFNFLGDGLRDAADPYAQ